MPQRMIRSGRLTLLILLMGFVVLGAAFAQERSAGAPRSLTAADYARAEKFMTYNVTPLVLRAGARPTWLPGDRFWYRNAVEKEGSEFILVDPAKRTKAPAFDHAGVAAALSAASGKTYDASHLPFTTFDLSAGRLDDRVRGRRPALVVRPAGQGLQGRRRRRRRRPPARPPARGAVSGRASRGLHPRRQPLGPRGRDGRGKTAHHGRSEGLSATPRTTPDGQRATGRFVLWSPDSKKIATFQQDQRGVGEMYLVETKVGHPMLQAWKYPLPGDEVVTMIERVVIHLDGPRVVRLKMPPDQHRGTVTDDIKVRGGDLDDAYWSADGSRLAFVSTSRDHKHEVLRVADPETGEVRDVFDEKVDTFFESGNGRSNWRFLAGVERDHLVLGAR